MPSTKQFQKSRSSFSYREKLCFPKDALQYLFLSFIYLFAELMHYSTSAASLILVLENKEVIDHKFIAKHQICEDVLQLLIKYIYVYRLYAFSIKSLFIFLDCTIKDPRAKPSGSRRTLFFLFFDSKQTKKVIRKVPY